MEEKKIPFTSFHVRNKIINGKKIRIDYGEAKEPDGRILIRYKTYVDDLPVPVEFVVSKEVLQMIQKNHDHSIYSNIPDSILELFSGFTEKAEIKAIIQNGKAVPAYRVLEPA